jgi:hypothetical protein
MKGAPVQGACAGAPFGYSAIPHAALARVVGPDGSSYPCEERSSPRYSKRRVQYRVPAAYATDQERVPCEQHLSA